MLNCFLFSINRCRWEVLANLREMETNLKVAWPWSFRRIIQYKPFLCKDCRGRWNVWVVVAYDVESFEMPSFPMIVPNGLPTHTKDKWIMVLLMVGIIVPSFKRLIWERYLTLNSLLILFINLVGLGMRRTLICVIWKFTKELIGKS